MSKYHVLGFICLKLNFLRVFCSTSVWLHRTTIPPQEDGTPSISYAADFYLGNSPEASSDTENDGLTNLDGLYALEDITSDTLLFKESDMPDCELHRSTSPNCELVELEDGTSAIVSIKNIPTGEFFSIAESSDEDNNFCDVDSDSDD